MQNCTRVQVVLKHRGLCERIDEFVLVCLVRFLERFELSTPKFMFIFLLFLFGIGVHNYSK
jgi:hypothetical protein